MFDIENIESKSVRLVKLQKLVQFRSIRKIFGANNLVKNNLFIFFEFVLITDKIRKFYFKTFKQHIGVTDTYIMNIE